MTGKFPALAALWIAAASLINSLRELGNRYAECFCDLNNIQNTWVPNAALNPAQISPIDVSFFR